MPATHIINKELISQIHKEFIKTEKTNIPNSKKSKRQDQLSPRKRNAKCSNPGEDSQPHSKQDGPIK